MAYRSVVELRICVRTDSAAPLLSCYLVPGRAGLLIASKSPKLPKVALRLALSHRALLGTVA